MIAMFGDHISSFYYIRRSNYSCCLYIVCHMKSQVTNTSFIEQNSSVFLCFYSIIKSLAQDHIQNFSIFSFSHFLK